ncbi:hypothetical protein ERX37_04830 [Macrococcus hajekii]|uniref:Uncharacterized protein n=1 Tax=Macrococcus hajekii TaxID=198482 RepID=A0A4R6BNW3_9STAP|nr:hypothetical protein [Macrococcus hajekii]TDM03412.1 hypothetical protein ERX37_04830 [Macrococcus hajekii]GGA98671.1 hypothetical protein GCM10007190_03320 [Macrococcus hajekii]
MLFNKSKASISNHNEDLNQVFKELCEKRSNRLKQVEAIQRVYKDISILQGSINYKTTQGDYEAVRTLRAKLKAKEQEAIDTENTLEHADDISESEYALFYDLVNYEMLPLKDEHAVLYERLLRDLDAVAETFSELNKVKKGIAKIQSRKESVDSMRLNHNSQPRWNFMLSPEATHTGKDDTPIKVSGVLKEKLEAVDKQQFKVNYESKNW